MKRPAGLWRVFRVPLLLAAVSGGSLVAALLFEGAIDLLWAAGVAVPLAAIAAALLRRRV